MYLSVQVRFKSGCNKLNFDWLLIALLYEIGPMDPFVHIFFLIPYKKDTEENRAKGFNYLLMAAEAGDRPSMIQIARAFDTGLNLAADR